MPYPTQATIAVLHGRMAVYTSAGAGELIATDLYASNGIVHTIDSSIPPW